MSDNPPPTSQATDDQLAALFLRDRDTPCPSCNYNRRDGTTSTCPECGNHLQLIGVDQSGHSHELKILKALVLVLLIYLIVTLVQRLLSLGFLIHTMSNAPPGIIQSQHLISGVLTSIIWILFLIFIIRYRQKLHKGIPSTTKQIIAPIVILLSSIFLINIGFAIMLFL